MSPAGHRHLEELTDEHADRALYRTRRADFLLYLDFDGVLQTQHVYCSRQRGIYIPEDLGPGRRLFEWAPLLEDALAPYPDLRIVLSTSWVRRPGFQKALKRLSPALQQRVIGATFHSAVHGVDLARLHAFLTTPRGEQIVADVRRRRPMEWLALDDDTLGWPPEHGAQLIACDGDTGLSNPATQRELTSKLAAAHARLLQNSQHPQSNVTSSAPPSQPIHPTPSRSPSSSPPRTSARRP